VRWEVSGCRVERVGEEIGGGSGHNWLDDGGGGAAG
jgi:hypothetical protein